MSEEKKKKGGFFKRTFGLKSKEDKLAEAAALKAKQQAQVDAQMAKRMAAINAAALKAAREQDEANLDAAEKERIEAEEEKQAQAQAQKDVEAAKRLIVEKKAKEEKAKNAVKEAKEKAKYERLEAEKKAKEEADRLKREQNSLKKANAENAERLKTLHKKERLEAQEQEEKRRTLEIKRLEAEKFETKKLEVARAKTETIKAQEALRKQEAEKTVQRPIEKPEETPSPPAGDISEKPGFFARITTGLKKSTSKMSDNISAVFTKRKLDDEALKELEDILIAADFGLGPASRTTALLAKDKFDKQITNMEIKIALADVISQTLAPLEKPLKLSGAKLEIMIFVGVNGSGKTTTLGKIAKRYTDKGKKVLMCAGDTFRAAAVEQLKVWGERSCAPVVSADLGADAAGLVFDAIKRARAENYDILMIDTAGRLQNRTELMDELSKIIRVIKKQDKSAPHHSILVLDATVGQNALLQTKAFQKTAGITGLIMTKLDGTAKGGVLVALADKFKLPIHFIGIGERIEDLENFSAPVFAAALSGVGDAVLDES
ncbi:MAG: signal recognition particle-docking protein FtsY [Robiginitomaculum sp.]